MIPSSPVGLSRDTPCWMVEQISSIWLMVPTTYRVAQGEMPSHASMENEFLRCFCIVLSRSFSLSLPPSPHKPTQFKKKATAAHY